MKAALGLMGTDQLSLTKCMITVSAGVDVRDWRAVLCEVRENFDPHFDFIMIPKVPLDTLDFTSYKMNLGSKMIVDATRKQGRPPASDPQKLKDYCSALKSSDRRIIDANLIEETLLLVKVESALQQRVGVAALRPESAVQLPQSDVPDPRSSGPGSSPTRTLLEELVRRPELASLKIVALVSSDVDIYNQESYIWGVFTRFDAERDIRFAESTLVGIAPIYRGVMGIDATWKPGYPEPLVMPDEIVKRVDEKWGRIWNK
jgi:4-hydroxy-3-polyprenylbenzoate decarboxylase